jgi:two-component system chemotaxis response regulator CheY
MARTADGVSALLRAADSLSELILDSDSSNGTEAVEAFRLASDEGYRFDLICMDIMMPEIDGREALKRIRTMEEQRGVVASQGTKFIMTTTVNDLKEAANCFGELCDDYLIKPINLTQLKNRMEQFQLL